MKKRILFIERQRSNFVSLEKVFRQVGRSLSSERFAIEFQQVPYSNDVVSVFKNLLFFKAGDADIFHITGHIHYISLLLPKRKTVLTIHDLAFLHTRKGLRRMVLKKLLLDWPLRRLKYVSTVSQQTKDEIAEFLPGDAEKIRVIENPLSDYLLPDTNKRFNSDLPTILQVGTMENKNVPRLIRALDGIKCKLRIIGPLDVAIRSALEKSAIELEHTEILDDTGMAQAYRNADIIAFCSTYEGFGLPIIEGQATGKPVVTSNINPMAEVAGGAAELVDPLDIASITAGFLRVILDRDHRNKMVEMGYANSKRFNATEIAAKYETLYDEVISGIT